MYLAYSPSVFGYRARPLCNVFCLHVRGTRSAPVSGVAAVAEEFVALHLNLQLEKARAPPPILAPANDNNNNNSSNDNNDPAVIPTKLTGCSILTSKPDACELVYLPSCDSDANKDLLLSEERLSTAGAFHKAGVPHMVSSMWQLEDSVASEVTGDFSRELVRGETAMALHESVRRQRDKGVHAFFWGAVI